MKKLKVLIVDDSTVMRKIVERSLRQAGLDLGEVLEASNGAEGLAEVQKGHLDLILSDINMPAMDGLEFLRSLASVELAKGVPVVMITTEGSEARVVEALSMGRERLHTQAFHPGTSERAGCSAAGRCAVSSTYSSSQVHAVTPDPHWKSILECAAVEVFNMMAGAELSAYPEASPEPAGQQTAMVGLAVSALRYGDDSLHLKNCGRSCRPYAGR